MGTGRAPEIVRLGDEVGDLVEAAGDEIDELHFDHGPQAEIAHAAGRADDGGFADGRVDHALGAEFREQAFGDLERAAVDADIFAESDDGGVALHLFEQRLANGLEHGDFGHLAAPPALLPLLCCGLLFLAESLVLGAAAEGNAQGGLVRRHRVRRWAAEALPGGLPAGLAAALPRACRLSGDVVSPRWLAQRRRLRGDGAAQRARRSR